MSTRTVVYTDGACSGNPGPGGWAWVVPHGRYRSGADAHTTNQRMELKAVLDAVRSLEGPLHVMSDSTYVVNCFRDRWWEGWLARGWLNSQKKPVANRDLWEPLVDLYQHRDLTFEWVKGHSGDEWNDIADRLAVAAGVAQRGDEGTGTPTDLGPADAPGSALSSSEIPGYPLVVMGLRPPELGGYDDNPLADAVRQRLSDVISAKASMHDDLVVVSGMNLGSETLAAEAAEHAGVPLEVVIPFPDPDQRWPESSRRRFRRLLDVARNVRTLEKRAPEGNQKVAASFRRREAWLRRNSREAIVVWDGKDGAIGKTVRSLQDELGEERVWIIDPAELSQR